MNIKRIFRILILVLSACAIFVALLILSGEKRKIGALANQLTSPDPAVRAKALRELNQARRKSSFYGTSFDIQGKYELFQMVVEVGDIGHLYGVSYQLSRLPEDEKLVRFSVDVVEKEKANRDIRDDRLLLLVGSLVYVEKQRPAVFQEYFKGKKYEDLNETIRLGFGPSDEVQDMKYEHQRKLVLAFLEWKPPSGTVDGPINPFRSKLLEMGDDLNLVLARMYPASGTGIPLPLIWLLGEIGHQNAFDILLQEYLARPSMRTAVSLGSCLGSLSPNYLFEAPFTSESTRELLQYIYGEKWEEVKDMSDDELKQNMLVNYEQIKADCRHRIVTKSN